MSSYNYSKKAILNLNEDEIFDFSFFLSDAQSSRHFGATYFLPKIKLFVNDESEFTKKITIFPNLNNINEKHLK